MKKKIAFLRNLLPDLVKTEISEDSPDIEFMLTLGDKTPIGTLSALNGEWIFKYFRSISKVGIKPIPDFPDFEKEYKSKELWPFFASRIPTSNHPEIVKKIHEENLDKDDPIQMLVKFGKFAATNPFILQLHTT